jgi:hypothetical protein
MLQSVTLDHSISTDNASVIASGRLTATATSDIQAIEQVWRRLANGNLESPGFTSVFITLCEVKYLFEL